ncbi:hypothetical protein SKAU_G00383230 [Synaphobranchus kaupii]|uniref:Uncharacterized protein n=1 Tax=Synaphobranchus kaupii TaxID=118154 RepID=A0A9Q1EE40_SYNKA|nr:hypothetical protein SKAU_G00383230 [Synaphobranchus kaupii]
MEPVKVCCVFPQGRDCSEKRLFREVDVTAHSENKSQCGSFLKLSLPSLGRPLAALHCCAAAVVQRSALTLRLGFLLFSP